MKRFFVKKRQEAVRIDETDRDLTHTDQDGDPTDKDIVVPADAGIGLAISKTGDSAEEWDMHHKDQSMGRSSSSKLNESNGSLRSSFDLTDSRTFYYTGQDTLTHNHNVKSIVIAASVHKIGDEAFRGWSQLERVILEAPASSKLTTVGDRSFSDCIALQSFGFLASSKLEKIQSFAFAGCSGVRGNLVLPRSTASIGPFAFTDCSGLETVLLPPQVAYIGIGAFCNCSSLIKIELPRTTHMIGASTFSGCLRLGSDGATFVVPDSVAIIGPEAFAGCVALHHVQLPCFVTTLVIIKEGAFRGCRSLDEMEIPNSVQRIGSNAFADCEQLKYVRLPSGLNELEDGVFRQCKLLHRVEHHGLPFENATTASKEEAGMTSSGKEGRLQTIGNVTFESSESFRFSSFAGIDDSHLDLPGGVKAIGNSCFEGCIQLTYVDVQSMCVQNIGKYAFAGCSNLRKVALSDETNSVGDGCFQECAKLQDVMVSFHGRYGSAVFSGCDRLKRLFNQDGQKYSFRTGQAALFNALVALDDCVDLVGTLLESGHFDLSSLSLELRDTFSEKVYESPSMQRALGCLGSDKFSVFLHMLDAYMNVVLMGLFVAAANEFLNDGHVLTTKLLFLPTAHFFFHELVQMRFEGLRYFLNAWNMADWLRIGLVVSSASTMLMFSRDQSGTISESLRILIMFTGSVSIYGFIFSLRTIFLPYAEFVGGLISVRSAEFPSGEQTKIAY